MTLLAELDARISTTEATLGHLRAVRLIIATERSGAAKPTKATKRTPAANGLHARILDILREHGEPMRPAVVVIACKAKDWDVKLAAKELAADGKITITGATTDRRYALVTTGGAK